MYLEAAGHLRGDVCDNGIEREQAEVIAKLLEKEAAKWLDRGGDPDTYELDCENAEILSLIKSKALSPYPEVVQARRHAAKGDAHAVVRALRPIANKLLDRRLHYLVTTAPYYKQPRKAEEGAA